MDIHNYKKRFERTLERISESKEISNKNKKTIVDFHDSCFAEDLSVCKIERYVYDLFSFTKMLEADLRKATKEDLKKIVAEIEKKGWSPHTKHSFKIMIRKFYKL